MQNVYLMMHQKRADAAQLAASVAAALRAQGVAVGMEPWLAQASGEQSGCKPEDFPMEAIVAVGGDGTLLHAMQTAIAHDVPVLGVNVGRIGFLVETEMEHLTQAVTRLKNGEYTLETRMMLDVTLPDGSVRTALNDVVLTRGGYTRLLAVHAMVDRELVGRYLADGLIVATPTGSTGYSLSTGGPIVCPEVECILLSPICPHSLQHRPVVASANQTVTVELDCAAQQTVQLDVDGRETARIAGGQRVQIRRSATVAKLVRFGDNSFFQRIRAKLTEWSC